MSAFYDTLSLRIIRQSSNMGNLYLGTELPELLRSVGRAVICLETLRFSPGTPSLQAMLNHMGGLFSYKGGWHV